VVDGGEVALVRLLGVKRRRLDEEGAGWQVVEDLWVVRGRLGPRALRERDGVVASGVPNGTKRQVGTGFGRGSMGGGNNCV